MTLLKLRRSRESENALREAIRLGPGDARPHVNLGVLLLELNRYPEAVSAFQEAVRLEDDARWHDNLGISLQAAGNTEEAEEAYRRALALDPNYVTARLHLAGLPRKKRR